MADGWTITAFLLVWAGVGLCAGIARREQLRARGVQQAQQRRESGGE